MRKREIIIILLFFAISTIYSFSDWALALERLRIASTTSVDNSGLFEALNPPFEEKFNCQVQIINRKSSTTCCQWRCGSCFCA